MGFLHQGHLSLIKKSKQISDITVVSIFVNPTQFAPGEDFESYPRNMERDINLLVEQDVDCLFCPEPDEIYIPGFQTYVETQEMTKTLEGESRPSHFKGVTTIVSILFNCVKPDFAFFGQKDAQQAAVIKRMNDDLKFGAEVITCPIVREPDGLALSSRNVYLSPGEREDAVVLSRSLKLGMSMVEKGEKNAKKITSEMTDLIKSVKSSDLDYVTIVDASSFEGVDKIEEGKKYYILLACRIGKTRLIDNTLLNL